MQPNVDTNSAIAGMVQSFDSSQPNTDIFSTTPPPPQPVYQQPQAPAQQQPVAPQTPQYTQTPPQAQPQGPQPEYPIVAPVANQEAQVPAWAAGLTQQVQTLQQQLEAQKQANQDNNEWPDRPQSWGEMRKAIQTEADRIASEKMEAYKREQKAAEDQQAAVERDINQQIDNTIGQMRQVGYLPVVANPNDPNDPGKAAERELIAYTVAMGGTKPQDLMNAAPSLKAHHDTGYFFDYTQKKLVRRGSQTAAAQAPIAGASPSIGGTPTGQQGPSQKELATMSMDQLMQTGLQQIQ